MIDQNNKLMDFVSLHLERFFDYKVWFAMKEWKEHKGIVNAYIGAYFSPLFIDLNRLWKDIISTFWNDSDKIFEMLSDFPPEYLEKLTVFWKNYFNKYQNDFKEDINEIVDKHRVKFDYISGILNYLDNQ